MERKFSKEMPVNAERVRNGFVLNYDVQETPMEEIQRQWKLQRGGMEGEEAGSPDASFVSEHKYMYYSVPVPMGRWSYGGIVDIIVREKYTVSEMESITNNVTSVVGEFFEHLVSDGILSATSYLTESFKGANTEAFAEMQLWRTLAKKEAKAVLKLE